MIALLLLAMMVEMGDGIVTDAPVVFVPDDAPSLVVPVTPPVAGPPVDPATATAPQGSESE